MEKKYLKTTFTTTDSELVERSGQEVTILWPLTDKEVDIEDVGPMYKVQFKDGFRTDAFENELKCSHSVNGDCEMSCEDNPCAGSIEEQDNCAYR